MLKFFRIVGFMEGLSFLCLVFVGVPMKHLAANPIGVKVLGMPHGLLFILYITLAFSISQDLKWPKKRLMLALAAAVLPFGTFIFDRKYLKQN